MRHFDDLSSLYRASIGFDRLFDVLRNAMEKSVQDAWPNYDILKSGEDHYQIRMALPGFTEDQLEITHAGNLLTVKGSMPESGAGEYLYRSLPQQDFQQRFELADYVKVTGAELTNGMLIISLIRELPEAMRPRRLQIETRNAGLNRIGNQKQAA
jgi:molecular chaperone IbpA